MRPIFEQIRPNPGSSFFLRRFFSDEQCMFPYWHLHPEYEIVYITQGQGLCHVGQHQSHFSQGLLIMLGPNLPHAPFGPHLEPGAASVVIQFKEDFLGENWLHKPEWQGLYAMMQRSSQGILFGTEFSQKVGQQIYELEDLAPLPRLLAFLDLLSQLAESEDYRLLEAGQPGLLLSSKDYDRIHRVMSYLQTHYQESISLQTAADLVHLTVPAFCRFFKRITQKTFTNYLHEYRIYHACQMLQAQQLAVGEISFQLGYQQTAYFNRQFKRIMGCTPTAYQKRFSQWIPV